ncbi:MULTISPECIES: ATPase [unclassified Pseudomonas]|uniref:ATPase n=1 Tax=Pseudomonas sp. MYb327 TaxID=2745230 RepID=A0AAU8E7B5_9PSED
MKLSALLAFVAVFTGSVAATAPAFAADLSCHFPPITDSAAILQQAKSVGVLYSENTVNTQEYLENYHAVAVNGAKNPEMNSQISQAFVDSSDPQRAINWLMGSLQKQFTSVTVYDNLDAAVQAHPDVVVMLDTYSRLVSKRNNQVEARFVARFYDSNLQYIGQAEGSRAEQMPSVWVHGKSAPQIAAQINQQTELQVNALKQFDASLKTLVTAGKEDHVASN